MSKTARLFAKYFGEMLLPWGFFLWKNGFYRIDSVNGLVWMVVMSHADTSVPCNVNYGVKAFCHGLDVQAFEGDIYQVNGMWRHFAERLDKSRRMNMTMKWKSARWRSGNGYWKDSWPFGI